jgi:AraC family transcriptional regulator of adaptative response/methylated-DNA-[protein]-cysteine methyltransferase
VVYVLTTTLSKGICALTFVKNPTEALQDLKAQFPKAIFIAQSDSLQQSALALFQTDHSQLAKIKLHLKGTAF